MTAPRDRAAMRHLLVANRGEIAVRILRSARARGLRTTAVYSSADADSPHVGAADQAVLIGPPPVGSSYLDIARVLDAARTVGADAVHPGYGLLSENAEFARACEEAGLTFVGPPVRCIEQMADKRAARHLAEQAGVPCVPGFDGGDGSESAFVDAAGRIGYPVMVKAAAGGGGRGMRRADDESALRAALPLARAEAQAAFGDGRLLLERVVEHARHVELQVFGDGHGGAIHLGERDCSVQRRFQKVFEESPSPAVDAALRARMGEAALLLVRAVGYVGAGTVEFLLAPDGAFYFLEMNTRLQVEHPVTELVTGLDLVDLQLAVADGAPLPLSQGEVRMDGHAIEARLYAEDPAADFMPQTGEVLAWQPPEGPGVRVDHALKDGLVISPHYDPMLAKIIAHGPDRAAALRRLDTALGDTTLLGPRHNRDFLRRVLLAPDFVAGQLDTAWLTGDGKALSREPAPTPTHCAVAALLLLLHGAGRRDHGELLGFHNARAIPHPFELSPDESAEPLYLHAADGAYHVQVGEHRLTLSAPQLDSGRGALRVVVDGVARRYRAFTDGERVQLDDGRRVDLRDRSRLPAGGAHAAGSGHIASPMDGAVVDLRVALGDRVRQGEVLLVIEAMKLQHDVRADIDGEVSALEVAAGDHVALGQRLAELSAPDGPGSP